MADTPAVLPEDALAAVLAAHSGFFITERKMMEREVYYDCVCGHRYEQYRSTTIPHGHGYQTGGVVPDPEQRRRVLDLHHKHRAGAIIAAGWAPPPPPADSGSE